MKRLGSITSRKGYKVDTSPVSINKMNSKVLRRSTLAIVLTAASLSYAGEPATTPAVRVVDGIVQPRRPLKEAIADAMSFFKKSDGVYVPGKIGDESKLPGYFTAAHVLEDGEPSTRKFAFPARQHAYFINTFLLYRDYSGQPEWLQRAKDLGDWNIVHSTPSGDVYGNLPWSVWTEGHGGGSRDKDAIEPDKAAWFGCSYLKLYETTNDERYLNGARAIAKTLAATQGNDGSWPFRVVPKDGTVRQALGGAPVFYVEFFQSMLKYDSSAENQKTYDRALKLMLSRNVDQNIWGTYHEDIAEKPGTYLSAEPMSFTAIYLFSHAKEHPEYIEMGRKVLSRMEAKLVHTSGHPAAPAPAVSEQAGFQHMMPGHTSRYCAALTQLYVATGDENAKRKAISGFNALTYMQSDAGLFRTMFQLVNEKKPHPNREDWYSQHLYTICHLLESLPYLPELK